VIARILIWDPFDSKTTLEEVRANVPALPEGDMWIANEAQDRFGIISFADELPDLGSVRDLIGEDAQVAEEFDVLA
jgi:hypothetical protein